jgi:hypothetical protein
MRKTRNLPFTVRAAHQWFKPSSNLEGNDFMTFKESIHNRVDADDTNAKDQDRAKGAVESDKNEAADTNTSMQGQLPHRVKDRVVKDVDSNLPG